MPNLKIYTDGSSLGNPGPGGWGVVILADRKKIELSGGVPHTTNNRMEMQAVIEALKWVKTHRKATASIDLYTDSTLLVKTLTHGWKRKKNQDLWEELDRLNGGLTVNYHWVKGHASNRHNNRCDQLAVQAAEKMIGKPAPRLAGSSAGSKASPETGQFTCPQCRKTTKGRLSLLPDSRLIRADCLHCGKFIMFAPKTTANRERAKKRPLLTKAQLKKVIQLKKKQGRAPTEKEIQIFKTWTAKETEKFLSSDQTLF